MLRNIQEVSVCSTAFSLSTGTILTEEQIKNYPLIGLGEQTASFRFYSDVFNGTRHPCQKYLSSETEGLLLRKWMDEDAESQTVTISTGKRDISFFVS